MNKPYPNKLAKRIKRIGADEGVALQYMKCLELARAQPHRPDDVSFEEQASALYLTHEESLRQGDSK